MSISCGRKKGKPNSITTISASNEISGYEIPSAIMERGLKVYKSHCFACHMLSGNGVKGIYPPLTENNTVTGDKSVLIGIILNGMSGEIVEKGEKFNQVMIPHDFLTNNQIADVLTYIRNSFGNQAEAVSSDEVKVNRKR